jgi:hypothetical protein
LGRQHDFKLFKASQIKVRAEMKILGDKGDRGIQNLHSGTAALLKRSPKEMS